VLAEHCRHPPLPPLQRKDVPKFGLKAECKPPGYSPV